MKNGINETHCVAYNNGFVIDGRKGYGVIPFNEFLGKEVIERIYGVELNPNVSLA